MSTFHNLLRVQFSAAFQQIGGMATPGAPRAFGPGAPLIDPAMDPASPANQRLVGAAEQAAADMPMASAPPASSPGLVPGQPQTQTLQVSVAAAANSPGGGTSNAGGQRTRSAPPGMGPRVRRARTASEMEAESQRQPNEFNIGIPPGHFMGGPTEEQMVFFGVSLQDCLRERFRAIEGTPQT